MAADRPIFVVGCPRSGTTMFTLMLHAHSRIAMPPETRFLMSAYRSLDRFGDLAERRSRRRLAAFIVRRRGSKFRDLGLERRTVRRAILTGPPTLGSAVGTVFRAYAQRFGKERWGDKRPTYFQSVEAIRTMFPDAQFVHLVRDGRDCVASLKRVPWYDRRALDAVALWSQAISMGRANRRALPPDSYFELQYEALVSDPRGELARLCSFLGEDFEEGMLEPHRVAHQAVPERKAWHDNTRLAVSGSSVGSHQGVLTPEELRLMNFVCWRKLRRLGYRVPLVPRPPGPGDLVRYFAESTRRRLGARRAIRRDRAIAQAHVGQLAYRGDA